MTIFFDIETLPTDDHEVIETLRAAIKPPANYTKQETIDNWMSENVEKVLDDLIAKTSFDALYGRVACIAWQIDSQVIDSSISSSNEGDAIQMFYDAIADQAGEKFCGHNIYGFDLPFLKQRSVILKIKPPKNILRAMNARQWDSCIADTMLMWSPERDKRASLDKLCKAFEIQGKGNFDGSMVAQTWAIDRQKVIEYCKDDVWRTKQIYERLMFTGD